MTHLILDNPANYEGLDDGDNGGDAVGNGHHGAGEVRTEVDVIDLKAADRTGVEADSGDKDAYNEGVIGDVDEAQADEGKSRAPVGHAIAEFADGAAWSATTQRVVWEPAGREADEPHGQIG